MRWHLLWHADREHVARELVEGLTPKVYERLPFLVETVVAELDRQGYPLTRKEA